MDLTRSFMLSDQASVRHREGEIETALYRAGLRMAECHGGKNSTVIWKVLGMCE